MAVVALFVGQLVELSVPLLLHLWLVVPASGVTFCTGNTGTKILEPHPDTAGRV